MTLRFHPVPTIPKPRPDPRTEVSRAYVRLKAALLAADIGKPVPEALVRAGR